MTQVNWVDVAIIQEGRLSVLPVDLTGAPCLNRAVRKLTKLISTANIEIISQTLALAGVYRHFCHVRRAPPRVSPEFQNPVITTPMKAFESEL